MEEGEKGAVIQRSQLLYHSLHGQRILSWEFKPETHLSLCWEPNKEEISFQKI